MDAPAKTRVLVVDDHPIVRQGLFQILSRETGLEVVGEAESPAEALKAVDARKPGLAVVDLSLEGESGLELVKRLKARRKGLRVLVLSMHDESIYAERSLRAGADGYIMKQEAADKLIEAIRAVMGGRVYVSAEMTGKLLSRMAGGTQSAGAGVDRLSDRELQVLELLGVGEGTRGIAARLGVSFKTVESHREHIKSKLGLKGASELLRFAIKWMQAKERGSGSLRA